jgi:uncharacterized protein YqgV (UPF0045/DUF77 family)
MSAEGFFIWLWQPLPRNLRTAGAFFISQSERTPGMIVNFSIRPIRQPSDEHDVTEGTETVDHAVDRTGVNGRPRSMSAAIEGSWDQVMSVIRGCHQAHVNGHPRVVTTIVVVEDNADGRIHGWPQLLREMVPPPEGQLGHAPQRIRHIPVEFQQ